MSVPDAPRRDWTDSWIAPAVVAAATTLVYLRALAGGFVFDDPRFIVDNPHVQRPQSWLAVFTDVATVDPLRPQGIVRPLRTVEFAAGRALFGRGPTAVHVHSVPWHAAAAGLLRLGLPWRSGFGRA